MTSGWALFDPGVQIENEAGDPAVFRRLGIRADVQGAPAREMGLGGPDLMSVDRNTSRRARPGAQAAKSDPASARTCERPPFVAAQ